MLKQRTGAAAALVALALVVLGLETQVPSEAVLAGRGDVRASGVTALLPPIVQQGRDTAYAGKAKLAGTVKFSPARQGRRVLIQRRLGGRPWQKVAVERQNRTGVVKFTGAAGRAGRPYTYQGVAVRYRGQAAVPAAPMSSAVWQQKFSDQFAGTSLDHRKWDYRALGLPTDHRTRSVSAKEAVMVRDGSVRLLVKQRPGSPGKFLNGHIGTHGKFSFTHGVAAARMKLQRGQGQHGAFWLQPNEARRIAGDPRNSGAEIDVVEYFGDGHQNGALGSFVYNYGVVNEDGSPVRTGAVWPRATAMLDDKDDWWKSYHVFSVEWTPRSYIFRVDGREHWRTRMGVSGVDEFLILSLLTSDYEIPRLDRSRLPSKMNVDWVRVWQK
ncbi:MAG: glycoside hydrolase family 16 protein [Nocardioides sp.]